MNEIIKEQLNKAINLPHAVNGQIIDYIPDDFDSILFNIQQTDGDEIKVTFAEYVINPFEGFDMHDRFNNGIAPYSKVMYGKILQETDKMYKFDLHSDVGDNHWIGWCYKKSCYVNHY